MDAELVRLARRVIDTTKYMALGTADEAGRPWVSPVWFACADYRHFHWVSSPEARHSQNLASRSEVAIAIYDPSVELGAAAAVYISGAAEELIGTSSSSASRSSIGCHKKATVPAGSWVTFSRRRRTALPRDRV